MLKAGLLPLVAGLYEKFENDIRGKYSSFVEEIVHIYEDKGVDIVSSSICFYENEIQQAINLFEFEDADAVIILFLAYHPSLDSINVLSNTKLPLIILDTTDTYSFNGLTDPKKISTCHGIHGVQDLCCMLRRYTKEYQIEAGHYTESDVIERSIECLKGCLIANKFSSSKVGIIGEPFESMGDFAVPYDEIEKTTGIKVIKSIPQQMKAYIESIEDSVLNDNSKMLSGFTVDESFNDDLNDITMKSVLAIKKWIREEKLDAFTFNFLDFAIDKGLPTIPFVAASILMGDSIGYAGEGDILTAALTGALMNIYPLTTFVEMFCPDWEGNNVFLSHMGEANINVIEKPLLYKKEVPYVANLNNGVMPCVGGVFMKGSSVLINFIPRANGEYRLLLVPCEIIEPPYGDHFDKYIRGWLKPQMPLDIFLKEYSMLGGTHHSCMCYCADIKALKSFAEVMGWGVYVLDKEYC